jgi:hypothetical protein
VCSSDLAFSQCVIRTHAGWIIRAGMVNLLASCVVFMLASLTCFTGAMISFELIFHRVP